MTDLVITDRIFGIEIEFFGVDHRVLASAIRDKGVDCHVEGYNHQTRSHWKIVTDASLSGRNSGEVVSPKLQGRLGLSQLKKVCEALKEVNAQVNRTCGLHVHLNSTDMTVGEIINVFDRYAHNEQQIDSMMPVSRRNSRWCGNCVKGTFANDNTKRSVANGLGRYYKVNLTNIDSRGSIEFRQHSGTTDFEKISKWLSFLMQFVEVSRTAQTAKNRFYHYFRLILENAGYTVTYDRTTDSWLANRQGDFGIAHTCYFTRDEIRQVYGINKGVKRTRLNDIMRFRAVQLFKEKNVRIFRDPNVCMVYGQINYDYSASDLNTSEPMSADTTTNWLQGIDSQVTEYIQSRINNFRI